MRYSRAGDYFPRTLAVRIDVETMRRIVHALRNKGNNERMKRATLEDIDIVKRALVDFAPASFKYSAFHLVSCSTLTQRTGYTTRVT